MIPGGTPGAGKGSGKFSAFAGLFAHMSVAEVEKALADAQAAMTARAKIARPGPAAEELPDPWADYAEHAELVPYGPQTELVRHYLGQVYELTPAEAQRWAAAHREVWGYAEGRPADHPARRRAWEALRAALETAGRVLPADLGPAYVDARKAIDTAGMEAARWPVLDLVMAAYAADLVGTDEWWTAEAHNGLLRPWELWLGGWPVVPASAIGRDPHWGDRAEEEAS